MTHTRTILVAGLAVALSIAAAGTAGAHGAGTNCDEQPCDRSEGWHMGPGMMGPGWGQQGAWSGMMGPGMMGPGMMGPGMMGPGLGQQGGWPGTMGPGAMQSLPQDLSAAQVEHMLQHQITWSGNPNLRVGPVEERDADTIVADIVTKDGSLVQRLEIDRHTGWMMPAE